MERLYQRLNNIVGWLVFAAALVIYLLTLEPTVSLWDCGEFISCAYKLQVSHPPGAPLFILIGRIFSLFAPSPEDVAFAVNTLSAVASAGAVMFLFWFTTFMARRLLIRKEQDWTWEKIVLILGAGVVAAFAGAFADSFWFSAVEGEVYALSAFFTMLILWAITKYVREPDPQYADRWLIFIALAVSMVIGVHLLGLLVIPVVTLLYFDKHGKLKTWKDFAIAFGVGALLLGFVQYVFIPGVPQILAKFELLFVNGMGLPFYSGMLFGVALIIAVIVALIWWTHKKQRRLWNLGAIGLAMLFLGYSIYAMIVIRSYANPPIDMNDPEDPFSLLSYLKREQYGDRPLLWGPFFTSQVIDYKKVGPRYKKDEKAGKYVIVGEKIKPVYDKTYFFPRIWSSQPEHVRFYRQVLGLKPGEEPTYLDNLEFLFKWQIGWMYLRYFLWNFAGRQNDIQGHWGIKYGNWLSGIDLVDEPRLGPQDPLPFFQAINKGRNPFFLLPLLLGLLGAYFHFSRRKWDAWAVFVFFFMTGIAIILWLNQTPLQPRERDYSYAGSFLAFAVWVGLGVIALYELIRSRWKQMKKPVFVAAGIAMLAFLFGPFMMGFYGWDDHNRAHRFTARDFAINYLESCDSNAILFTEGDNDTYPLWYAQEVEGIRTDVRIINLSLLGVDWYIDFLRRKVNNADPVPINVDPYKYWGDNRNYVPYVPNPRFEQDKYYDLDKVLEFIFSDHPATRVRSGIGTMIDYLPVRKVRIKINRDEVIRNGIVEPEDTPLIASEMRWELPRTLLKNHLMTLLILNNVNWKRPIHFAVTIRPSSFVGLNDYLQLEGLTYQVVPIKGQSQGMFYGRVQPRVMFTNFMHKFRWGNLDKYRLYLDESHRRMAFNHRIQAWRLAQSLIAHRRLDSARQVLETIFTRIPDHNLPWDMISAQLAGLYYPAGAPDKARPVFDTLLQRSQRDLDYYLSLPPRFFAAYLEPEFQQTLYTIQIIQQQAALNGDTAMARKAQELFNYVDQQIRNRPDLLQILGQRRGQ